VKRPVRERRGRSGAVHWRQPSGAPRLGTAPTTKGVNDARCPPRHEYRAVTSSVASVPYQSRPRAPHSADGRSTRGRGTRAEAAGRCPRRARSLGIDPMSDQAFAVGLIVTELVGNACAHGSPMLHLIDVTVWTDGRAVTVIVTTPLRCPTLGVASDDDESGRGLLLIDAYAADHGWHRSEIGKRCGPPSSPPYSLPTTTPGVRERNRAPGFAPVACYDARSEVSRPARRSSARSVRPSGGRPRPSAGTLLVVTARYSCRGGQRASFTPWVVGAVPSRGAPDGLSPVHRFRCGLGVRGPDVSPDVWYGRSPAVARCRQSPHTEGALCPHDR